eukprot:COSAG05_NODE_139_length_16772_cov_35.582559_13_plen_360_part_00
MSPPSNPMGGGAFIIARRGTVYVTPGPYLPIAKSQCAHSAQPIYMYRSTGSLITGSRACSLRASASPRSTTRSTIHIDPYPAPQRRRLFNSPHAAMMQDLVRLWHSTSLARREEIRSSVCAGQYRERSKQTFLEALDRCTEFELECQRIASQLDNELTSDGRVAATRQTPDGVATKGAGIVEPESPRTQFRRAVCRGAGAEPRSSRSYNNSTGCCDCGCNRRLRICLHLWKNRNELIDIFKKGWKEDQGGLAFGLRMGLGLGLGVGLGVAVGWQNALPMPAAVSSPPPTTRRAHTLSIHYMNTISILSYYLPLTSGLFPLPQHGTICHRSLLRCLAACRLGCCWDLFGALYLGAGLTVL